MHKHRLNAKLNEAQVMDNTQVCSEIATLMH